jgi:hypothetical protein
MAGRLRMKKPGSLRETSPAGSVEFRDESQFKAKALNGWQPAPCGDGSGA